MFDRFLPERLDNTYRGYKIALWLFGLVVPIKAGKLIAQFLPVVRTGTPPGFYVTLALIIVMIIGLALSLRSQSNLRVHEA
jgi:hypothetical protein